jgi:hypothetical protein
MKKGWVFIRRSAFFCQSVASLTSLFLMIRNNLGVIAFQTAMIAGQ